MTQNNMGESIHLLSFNPEKNDDATGLVFVVHKEQRVVSVLLISHDASSNPERPLPCLGQCNIGQLCATGLDILMQNTKEMSDSDLMGLVHVGMAETHSVPINLLRILALYTDHSKENFQLLSETQIYEIRRQAQEEVTQHHKATVIELMAEIDRLRNQSHDLGSRLEKHLQISREGYGNQIVDIGVYKHVPERKIDYLAMSKLIKGEKA
jgi:hypothetical protein